MINGGEFIGEMSFINGEPRNANVKALEASDLIEIPNNLMNHILFTKPSWVKALMKTLSMRVKSANSVKD
jgi:CRP/FNR family transcriptional regulator, cyclic AMP receptor protein